MQNDSSDKRIANDFSMKTNMTSKQLLIPALATAALTLFIGQLSAHSVWIESTDSGELIARFGEFGDEDYETSPGHLDSLEDLAAWTPGSESPVVLAISKKKDHFALGEAKSGDSIQVEAGFRTMTSKDAPGRKPYFYARWRSSETEVGIPAATLDLVPTGKPGEIRAYFRGEPLAGVKATLFTPEANDQELMTDAEGILRFESNEKGLFMLKIGRHREERVGFSKGSTFGLVSHNSVITWVR